MDIVEHMKNFGLTGQEASIYLALLTEGDLNGYEVAKVTGISRSNAYTSLAALVEKGGAYVIEGAPVRYTAVPIDEFCANKINKLQETKLELIRRIPGKRDETEGYITIKGENHIIDKLRNMISEAEERIYLSVSQSVLENILAELAAAIARGLKVVLITSGSFVMEGAKIYIADKSQWQIRLIADSANVLTGDIDNGEYSTCLYSRKKNLVDLFKESMKNEIKLIEIMKGGGDA